LYLTKLSVTSPHNVKLFSCQLFSLNKSSEQTCCSTSEPIQFSLIHDKHQAKRGERVEKRSLPTSNNLEMMKI